jgi:hypothetical protein
MVRGERVLIDSTRLERRSPSCISEFLSVIRSMEVGPFRGRRGPFRGDEFEFGGPRPMVRGERVPIEGHVVVTGGAGVVRAVPALAKRELGEVTAGRARIWKDRVPCGGALAKALEGASAAGRLDVVSQLAKELEARASRAADERRQRGPARAARTKRRRMMRVCVRTKLPRPAHLALGPAQRPQ